jgi:ribosome-binding ATPase YchF (GTP1/OBG family)
VAERDWLEQVVATLEDGRPVREVPVPADAPEAPRLLQALSSKPILYVANVDEGSDVVPEGVAEHAQGAGAEAVAISARIESELAEIEDPEEAAELRDEMGISESGLARVIRTAFDLLELITFFTAGEDKEAMARNVRRGSTAWESAAKIHGDIQKAFVRAEVVSWRDLVEAGGYAGARERGRLRLEGRDYVMADGDVITVKV